MTRIFFITDIKTEWDQITSDIIAESMINVYKNLTLPFTQISEHRYIPINKSDSVVNLTASISSNSLSKILILAIDPDDRKQFAHTEKFKNLDITKVDINNSKEFKMLMLCTLQEWKLVHMIKF